MLTSGGGGATGMMMMGGGPPHGVASAGSSSMFATSPMAMGTVSGSMGGMAPGGISSSVVHDPFGGLL